MGLAPEPPGAPTISVLMPTFNQRPEWLGQAILSVLAQSHPAQELIVVTAPDDANADLLRIWAGELRPWLVLLEAPQASVHGQWLYGMMRARGALLTKCDSDDYLLPGKLEIEVEMLGRREECQVAYTGFFYADERLRPAGRLNLDSYVHGDLERSCVISEGALIRRELWAKIGWLDLQYKYASYWDAVLKMSEACPSGIVYDPVPTWFYRHHKSQVSGQEIQTRKSQELRWRVVKEHFLRVGRTVPDWEISVQTPPMEDV